MASEKFNKDITVYGTKKGIEDAMVTLRTITLTGVEPKDRILIAKLIEEFQFDAEILYQGNTVWNQKKLVKNLHLIINKHDMGKMNDYLYKFLSLSCGSIAHFNRFGWIAEYPTIEALRSFFQRNEFGQSVLQHQPMWKTDAIEIVKEMNAILGVRG
jgi:hypothetical protein